MKFSTLTFIFFTLFETHTRVYGSSILLQHPPQHWQQMDNKAVYFDNCFVLPNMVDCLEIQFGANNFTSLLYWRSLATSQLVWDPKFLSKINNKLKILKVILNELSPNTMSNTFNKYRIITFSKVNNPDLCHPYMLITENYSSRSVIISFWAVVLKFPAENGIPKKSQDVSLHIHLVICILRNFLKIFKGYKAIVI